MTGNWANLAGCHKIVVWSAANSAQASTNFADHDGIGTGVYWFMGGPGVDPHYNGTTGEAHARGEQQAGRTLAEVAKLHVTYPVVFMDIEIPGNAPDYTRAPTTAGIRCTRLRAAAWSRSDPCRRASTGPTSTGSPPT